MTKQEFAAIVAVPLWITHNGVGHAVRRRGPIVAVTYCERSLGGPCCPEAPARICGKCRSLAEFEFTHGGQTARTAVEHQGRLF